MITILLFGRVQELASELVDRKDIEVRWAMTIEEARAVIERVRVDIVLLGDPHASSFFAMTKDMSRRPPSIVVLSPDAWQRRSSYHAAGATVVVSNNAQSVLEALSELTGLAFRSHPRVKLETILDVELGGKRSYLISIDLSASGLAIADFPAAVRGDRARIGFELFDPRIVAEAMVVRTFQRGDELCAGLCFIKMSDDHRRALNEVLAQQIEKAQPMPRPPPARFGDDTMDLMKLLQLDEQGLATCVEMLAHIIEGHRSWTPEWLVELAKELTPSEIGALTSRHGWAWSAVNLRVALRKRLLEDRSGFDIGAAPNVLELLGFPAAADGDAATDATLIRAQLLRDSKSER